MKLLIFVAWSFVIAAAANSNSVNDNIDYKEICETLVNPIDDINYNIAEKIKDSLDISNKSAIFFNVLKNAVTNHTKGIKSNFNFDGAKDECYTILNGTQQKVKKDDHAYWKQVVNPETPPFVDRIEEELEHLLFGLTEQSDKENKNNATTETIEIDREVTMLNSKNQELKSFCSNIIFEENSVVPCLCLNWTIQIVINNDDSTKKNATSNLTVPLDADFDGHCKKNDLLITFRWLSDNNDQIKRTNQTANQVSLHLVSNNSKNFHIDRAIMSLNLDERDSINETKSYNVVNSSLKFFPAFTQNGIHVCDTEAKIPIDSVTIIISFMKLLAFDDETQNTIEEYCIVQEKKHEIRTSSVVLAIVSGVGIVAVIIFLLLVTLKRKKTVHWDVPAMKSKTDIPKTMSSETVQS